MAARVRVMGYLIGKSFEKKEILRDDVQPQSRTVQPHPLSHEYGLFS